MSESLFENSLFLHSVVGKEEIIKVNIDDFASIRINGNECTESLFRFKPVKSKQFISIVATSLYDDSITRLDVTVLCPPHISLDHFIHHIPKLFLNSPSLSNSRIHLISHLSANNNYELNLYHNAIAELSSHAQSSKESYTFSFIKLLTSIFQKKASSF